MASNNYQEWFMGRLIGRPPRRDYYVVRVTYSHNGIPATAIALLPTTEVSTWANFSMYSVKHTAALLFQVQKNTNMGRDALDSIASDEDFKMDYLLYPSGARVVVPRYSLKNCDRCLCALKPLWDEYAMLYTADTKAKRTILRPENFGSYADQFLEKIERLSNKKGFFWRLLEETNMDPTTRDYDLEFDSEPDEPTNYLDCE